MMESNLTNEQTTKMKTQTFLPIKQLVQLISFLRNSISSRAGSAKAQQQRNECLDALHDNTSVYQLKPLAHLGLIPATLRQGRRNSYWNH